MIMAKTEACVVKGVDVPAYDLESGGRLQLLDGAEHGFGDVSIIVSEYPAGGGADIKHRHPHISSIVITAGQGRFVVNDETLDAGVGDIVVVPANAWHSFTNTGDDVLRIVGVHDASRHAVELTS
jgi:quercetin dioxygenase-like cupin family protein